MHANLAAPLAGRVHAVKSAGLSRNNRSGTIVNPIRRTQMGSRFSQLILGTILSIAAPIWAQHDDHASSAHGADPTTFARAAQDMAKAANNLLATYTPEQKQAGVFELTDA